MKEKLQAIGYKVTALFMIIIAIIMLCAMLAGPLMIGWNFSFGLITESVTYIKCFKFITIIVVTVALISATLNILTNDEENSNG